MFEPRHVFACLVHEAPECVADLVSNLRYLDPRSEILLYDGSPQASLLQSGSLPQRPGVHLHPQPKVMSWGRLHEFGLDCMRFSLDELDADVVTIVDSDQLAVRAGYSEFLAEFLAAHPRAGCLVNEPARQPKNTRWGPAKAAWSEIDLWRPFLRRFPNGEEHFPHWTFWPSTVFTQAAARDLLQLMRDEELTHIIAKSNIWASEEVILPSLVALAGHEVLRSPCSYDLVRYRVGYTPTELESAMKRPNVFWAHPIVRKYDDRLRAQIRSRFDDYVTAPTRRYSTPRLMTPDPPSVLLSRPLLSRVASVEGWLSTAEADLLLGAAIHAVTTLEKPVRIVEIGSYCGKSTTVLGSAAKALDPEARVYAVDPHEGEVGAPGQDYRKEAPTLERFQVNMATAGLNGVVELVQQRSFDVSWDGPISLLFIDGLHDYFSVASDYSHFDRWIVKGGFVAFHDYASFYPGVKAFVDHLVETGTCVPVGQADSLVVLRRERDLGVGSMRLLVDRMRDIEGWLQPEEAALLAVTGAEALRRRPDGSFIEVGSYCGKATVVLAGIMATQPNAERRRVVAVDTFDGTVGARGVRLFHGAPTRDRFDKALVAAGLSDQVIAHQGAAPDVEWSGPISLLLIDGLHDYGSIAQDFGHFQSYVVPEGFVAFHDYADYYPGVKAFVQEVLARGGYRQVALVGSMVVLNKDRARLESESEQHGTPGSARPRRRRTSRSTPMVSCIMPTYNRRRFVPLAIDHFLQQDYSSCELIVVDDGSDAIEELIPDDDSVRYIQLNTRRTIGAKRNVACSHARGELIAHWDDDDWFAPWRLGYQVRALLDGDADICGLSTLFYWDVAADRAWRYQYSGGRKPWVHDPTFCYRRRYWERNPFPDVSFAIDSQYLWRGAEKRVITLDDPSFYVGIIHGGNTSPKRTQDPRWSAVAGDDVRALLGDAAARYAIAALADQ
jgi:hypothetical protein